MAGLGKDVSSDGSEKEKEGSDGIEMNQQLFVQKQDPSNAQTVFLTKETQLPVLQPGLAIKCQ